MTALLALVAVALAAACGGSGGGSSQVSPSPATEGVAVYLSLGDSIQADRGDSSAGALFRDYLSHTLRRRVEWVSLGGDDSAEQFMQRRVPAAEARFREWRNHDRPIVAITFSLGSSYLLRIADPDTRQPCATRLTPACGTAMDAALAQLKLSYEAIFPRLTAARDPRTPILVLGSFDPTGAASGQVSLIDSRVASLNAMIREEAAKFGLVLVDVYPQFKGRAADLVQADGPTAEGDRLIADAYARAYESLGPAAQDAFRLQTPATAGPGATTTGLALLVPSRLPAGVSLAAPEFSTTDNGIAVARLSARTADGREAFVIDEQTLVEGDRSGPDLGETTTIRGHQASVLEGPPRLLSWVEGSLWLTVRSDSLSMAELRALAESLQPATSSAP